MHRIIAAILFLGAAVFSSRADTLNLSNGDRYQGIIQSVTATEVHLKSEVVGLLKVPREKVASIYFGTNLPPVGKVSTAKASDEAIDSKAIEQVQKEFLATATPEANQMFTDLVQGLTSGKLSVNDIRKQAADSLKELREMQSEIDEEDNALLSGYVSILEKFIRAGETNKPAAKPPKTAPKRLVPTDDE